MKYTGRWTVRALEIYAMYQHVVISSAFGDWKTSMLPCQPSTIPLV
jgi:hypothetical protein